MIEPLRRRGWRWLCVMVAYVVVTILLLPTLERSRARLYIGFLWLPLLFAYYRGLYFLVKARGRHGAWAAFGAITWIGWIILSRLQDRAPQGREPGAPERPPSPILGEVTGPSRG